MSLLKFFENDDKNKIIGITKECNICKKELSIENFAISNTTPKKIHRKKICKKCHNERQKDRVRIEKTCPEKSSRCDICKKECKTLMDHCHTKLIFRGWLCIECNTSLGLIGDNISTLEEMIKYLKKHKTNVS